MSYKNERRHFLGKAVFLTVLIICVLLCGFWLYQRLNRASAPQMRTGVTVEVSHDPGEIARPPAIRFANRQVSALQALPAENAPLKDTYADLVARSYQGDASASMRLFRDLNTCSLRAAKNAALDYASLSIGQQAENQQGSGLGKAGAVATAALNDLDKTEALCDDVSRSQIDQKGEFLRSAALQGNAEAMVCYSVSYQLGPTYLSDAWFDYVSRWAREAPIFAQEALNRGQTDIIPPLIAAFSPDDPTILKTYSLSEVVAPNPTSAYTLALLSEHLATGEALSEAQRQVATLGETLPPAVLASAKQAADTLSSKFSQSSNANGVSRPCPEFLFPEYPR